MDNNFNIQELKEKGLKVSGNKSELVQKILNNQPKLPLANLPADILKMPIGISEIPTDILRVTALNLPVRDILNLCQTNKQFQQTIYNNKPFLEALFVREVKERINIPPNVSIEWYKEKIKIHKDVKIVADLIREDKVRFEFISPRKAEWNSFELVENLVELDCKNNQLLSLPPMPNLQVLDCDNNQLTSLPAMPNLQRLYCDHNQLTSLIILKNGVNNIMPNLQVLYCDNNKLTSLPPMPNLQRLDCNNNKLTSLPPMPNLQVLSCNNNQLTSLSVLKNAANNSMPNLQALYCRNNPLPFFTLPEWKQYWNKNNLT